MEQQQYSPTRAIYPFPRMDSQHRIHPSEASQSVLRTSRANNLSTLSLASRFSLSSRVAALEVYDLMYGHGALAVPPETVERLYEANAALTFYSCACDRYENPLLTASSRDVIADINALSRQLAALDVPRPLAVFKTLFRPPTGEGSGSAPWFQALRVWSDIEDICESESFDGHHMSIIEHTMNVLILPGLHSDSRGTEASTHTEVVDSTSTVSTAGPAATMTTSMGPPPPPSLSLPGLRFLSVPSPFHLQLHVITRLYFNEQGRITRHRDFWDVRDVLGLVPGMQVAQWLSTRVAAQSLSLATRAASWMLGRSKDAAGSTSVSTLHGDVERGGVPVEVHLSTTTSNSSSRGELPAIATQINALGLHLDDGGASTSPTHKRRSGGHAVRIWGAGLYSTAATGGGASMDAPDVDRDP